MLAIAVRFTTGRYYAASHSDRTRPEWPPHPDRLFSALVAAYYQSSAGTGRSALEWLERQGPPSLAVPHLPHALTDGRTMLAMVRTNDAETGDERGSVLPDRRKLQPRVFPSIGVDAPVYFIWQHANADPDTAAALATITTHMPYLGSSKSPILAWIEDTPPTPTLLPGADLASSGDDVILRVPTPGRLVELETQYDAGLRPRPGRQQTYHWATPSIQTGQPTICSSSFGDMFILARTSGPAPSPEAGLTVTRALRRALLAICDDGQQDDTSLTGVPALLHGHGPKGSPHCAFVALPHVGAPHADGHLLGVAVVFPRKCDPEQRRTVLQALSRLEYVQIPTGRIGVAPIAHRPPDAMPWGLQSARWSGPEAGASTWASVSPVLFDHFPRASRGGIFGAAHALTRHAGLPAPLAATAHQISPLLGVPPPSAYRTLRTRNNAPHYVAHLTITFDQPVLGPLLLGAGRFFGLGLFVPLPTRTA